MLSRMWPAEARLTSIAFLRSFGAHVGYRSEDALSWCRDYEKPGVGDKIQGGSGQRGGQGDQRA